MPFEYRDIIAFNESVKEWDTNDKQDILSEMDNLNIKHSKNSPNKIPLRKALKSALSKKHEMVNKISYKMPRSAVFLHKGVSRGHGINNPRQAKEWFNPVVEKNLPDLADRVADKCGDLVVNALQIK